MKNIIIIPARMQSQRLPGKPMLEAGDKPLLRWTYEKARQSKADGVFVATPDDEIFDYCMSNGIGAVMTEKHHKTGTNRCAEAYQKVQMCESDFPNATVVNLQVDEPFVEIDDLNALLDQRNWPIATIVCSLLNLSKIQVANRDVTKVAASNNRCHWFTRTCTKSTLHAHVGVYAYRSVNLLQIAHLPQSYASQSEGLEQSTWIESGWEIKAIESVSTMFPLSINSQEDFDRFKKIVEG